MNVYKNESSDKREAQGKKSERVHCSPSDGGLFRVELGLLRVEWNSHS